jgi:hypothetical protein
MNSLSFSTEAAPEAKIAPAVVAGGVFVARSAAGGAIGTAAGFVVNRVLNNAFPAKPAPSAPAGGKK